MLGWRVTGRLQPHPHCVLQSPPTAYYSLKEAVPPLCPRLLHVEGALARQE